MNQNKIYNYNQKSLKKDINIIKENINIIENKLKNINIYSNKFKYLSLSCIFGAFLGDSIGANCEFFKPSDTNYLYIYKDIKGRFLP